MKAAPALCCAIALMALGSTAPAQTETRSTPLYRCGPEGRDLRDSPCPEAPAKAPERVQHDEASPAQQREARERQRQMQRQADALERERRAAEAAAKPARATGIDGLRAAAPADAASQPKAGKPHKPKPAKRVDAPRKAPKPAPQPKPTSAPGRPA